MRTKHVRVAHVLTQTPINIAFRRRLEGNKWNDWLHLCQRLMAANLSTQKDVFVWKLTDDGKFYIKSMYLDTMNDHLRYRHKYLWKLKMPLEIKKNLVSQK